jgi:hypothetical protein
MPVPPNLYLAAERTGFLVLPGVRRTHVRLRISLERIFLDVLRFRPAENSIVYVFLGKPGPPQRIAGAPVSHQTFRTNVPMNSAKPFFTEEPILTLRHNCKIIQNQNTYSIVASGFE